jgi:DNA-directed RNA polymerase subunit RPC12/RpoP
MKKDNDSRTPSASPRASATVAERVFQSTAELAIGTLQVYRALMSRDPTLRLKPDRRQLPRLEERDRKVTCRRCHAATHGSNVPPETGHVRHYKCASCGEIWATGLPEAEATMALPTV